MQVADVTRWAQVGTSPAERIAAARASLYTALLHVQQCQRELTAAGLPVEATASLEAHVRAVAEMLVTESAYARAG